MKRRIVILGAGGQLGYAFARLLGEEALPLHRGEADLRRTETIVERLCDFRPDAVINCAAYNQVDRAESEPEVAMEINALAVRRLARWCEENRAAFVHFSTNYVFGLDHTRRIPFREEDIPGPIGAYGTSKLAGECFALSECSRSLVLRTCGLFGPRPPGSADANFVAVMARLAMHGKSPAVVDDQVCTPTHVDDVAQAALNLLRNSRFGLYHLTAAGECTWFEFAQAIFRALPSTGSVRPIGSAEYGAPARRPLYSVLNCGRLKDHIGFEPRTWQAGLEDYLEFRRRDWGFDFGTPPQITPGPVS